MAGCRNAEKLNIRCTVTAYLRRVVVMTTPHELAVLYIPPGLSVPLWWKILAGWTERQGWQPAAFAQDWAELMALLSSGRYRIGVVATAAHLPVNRRPLLVIADEYPHPCRSDGRSSRRPVIRA